MSYASGLYQYASFPSDPSQDWDKADGGLWQGILSYFGNATSSCSDWSIAQTYLADKSGLIIKVSQY
jgi:hypothetical protein